MIKWLVQTIKAHSDLARGIPPPGLLSQAERERFHALKTDKRRRDWLLGRWTAKKLLSSILADEDEYAPPLSAIEITNDPRGVPLAVIDGRTPYSLSISHSHDHAFCAIITRPSWPIGADMEKIEPRSPQFVTDYFSQVEQEQVQMFSAEIRDVAVTAVWSAKEAALKALGLGLRVDTRRITCQVKPTDVPPTAWTPFTIQLSQQLSEKPQPDLTGWWQVQGDFVLTLITQEEAGD